MTTVAISELPTVYARRNRFNPAWRGATLGVAVVLAAAINLPEARASIWTGTGGNWSSIYSAGPPVVAGWDTVPDGAGAVADFSNGGAGTTTVDVSTRTVGTLTLGGTGGNTRTITDTAGLTFNNSGAGAVISNTDTATGSRISFGSGTYTLQDNLLISNTGGSTSTSGSITFATLNFGSGSTGDITFFSDAPASGDAGRISLGGTGGSFTGSILIEKGRVAIGGSTNALGTVSNALTLGSSGQGSATLVTTGSGTTVSNNITVASGTTGQLLLGLDETGTGKATFSGTILLNGDLSVSGGTNVGSATFSGVISGGGGLTVINTAPVTLKNANTYNGDTTITGGTLVLAAGASINNSAAINLNGGSLDTSLNSTFIVGSGQTLMGQGTYTGAALTTVNGILQIGQTHNVAGDPAATFTSSAAMTLGGPDQFDLVAPTGATGASADHLAVAGALSYGGTLEIANPNGFAFAAGQNWDLFDFTTESGAFANDSVFGTAGDGTNLPTLVPGLAWNFDYSTGILSIESSSPVPEPASLALLSLGTLGLLRRRRAK